MTYPCTNTPESCLILAQKHLECLNEAHCEFDEAFGPRDEQRKTECLNEISARVWAAIYLIQFRDNPERLASEEVIQILKEADDFDGIDPEEDSDDAPVAITTLTELWEKVGSKAASLPKIGRISPVVCAEEPPSNAPKDGER